MIAIYLGLTSAIAGIDLVIKNWVESHLDLCSEKKIWKGYGILRRVHNKGMMLNVGEEHPGLVKKLSCVMTIGVSAIQILLLGRREYAGEKLGISLVLGGAISNTYDRVRRGFVVDFFGFNCKSKKRSSITYNIGDFAIFLGTAITIASTMFHEK